MTSPGAAPRSSIGRLSLAALGVVFGDIGTSPLYAVRECFRGEHSLPATAANVLGVLSLIFWSLTIVISVKYVLLVLRADNDGEGGELALTWLAARGRPGTVVLALGLFGASLLYGDGMITPAISVLSAVEGIGEVTTALDHLVVPITVVLLVLLFAFQQHGTARVGALFGPVMLVWFATLGGLGIHAVATAPEILRALDPSHALRLFTDHGPAAFLVMGAVFLVVTGGEALYADMGHFGRRPIRLAWFAFVMPALLLNYFGQGALLLRAGGAPIHPFYDLAPRWGLVPLVVLATMATVIASQAVITGAFSLTLQAVQLGFSPRLEIRHTSEHRRGQIYVPAINWILMAASIALVVAFRSSGALASAYGLAVATTMVITTILLGIVGRRVWRWSGIATAAAITPFLIIDVMFFAATGAKFFSGGWFAISVAAIAFLLMSTWRRGREALRGLLRAGTVSEEEFARDAARRGVHRVPGTAIFMSRDDEQVPPVLLHNVKHNKILHEHVVMLTVQTVAEAYCPEDQRVEMADLGGGIHRCILRYGFAEEPNVPESLMRFDPPAGIDLRNASFFLGRETLVATRLPPLPLWQAVLFRWMVRNSGDASRFFRLPIEQVVEIGARIAI